MAAVVLHYIVPECLSRNYLLCCYCCECTLLLAWSSIMMPPRRFGNSSKTRFATGDPVRRTIVVMDDRWPFHELVLFVPALSASLEKREKNTWFITLIRLSGVQPVLGKHVLFHDFRRCFTRFVWLSGTSQSGLDVRQKTPCPLNRTIPHFKYYYIYLWIKFTCVYNHSYLLPDTLRSTWVISKMLIY